MRWPERCAGPESLLSAIGLGARKRNCLNSWHIARHSAGKYGRTMGIRLAEREGFEPPIRLPVCRISSAVHSTALPPLRRRTARGVFSQGAKGRQGSPVSGCGGYPWRYLPSLHRDPNSNFRNLYNILWNTITCQRAPMDPGSAPRHSAPRRARGKARLNPR